MDCQRCNKRVNGQEDSKNALTETSAYFHQKTSKKDKL